MMAVEHAPSNRRGFYGSWVQMGVPAGLVLADGVFILFERLPEEAFLAWGWRIPFILSILLVAVGLYIRLRVEESPAFSEAQESEAEPGMPILDVIRKHPKNVLLAMGARLGDNALFYVFSVFVLTYVADILRLPESLALTGVLVAAAIEFFVIPAFGALSDKIGRRPVYMGGAAFCILFAFPYFWLLNTESTVLIWLAIVLSLAVGHAAMYAPRRTSSPSSSARVCVTAGPLSATSSRRSSGAASRRSSPPRCSRGRGRVLAGRPVHDWDGPGDGGLGLYRGGDVHDRRLRCPAREARRRRTGEVVGWPPPTPSPAPGHSPAAARDAGGSARPRSRRDRRRPARDSDHGRVRG